MLYLMSIQPGFSQLTASSPDCARGAALPRTAQRKASPMSTVEDPAATGVSDPPVNLFADAGLRLGASAGLGRTGDR